MKAKQESPLRESESRLPKIAARLAKVGSFYFDVPQMSGEWSEEMFQIHGMQPGRTPTVREMETLLSPEDARRYQAAIQRAIAEGKPYELEMELLLPDGERRWIRSYGEPVFEEGKVIRIEGAVQNITELKSEVSKANLTDSIFGNLFSLIPDLFFLFDREGKILDYRAQNNAETYVPPEAFLGRYVQEILPPQVADQFMHYIGVSISTGQAVTYEYALTIQSQTRWYECRLNQVPQAETYAAVIRDITERKKTEELLSASEARYREIFQNNDAVQLLVDVSNSSIADANKAACAYYGYSLEQIRQKTLFDINPNSREYIRSIVKKSAERGSNHFTTQHIRADHSIREVDLFNCKIQIDGKEMMHVIIYDITEMEQAKRALEQSNTRLNLLFENAPFPIIAVNMKDKKIHYRNKRAGEFFTLEKMDQSGERACHIFSDEEDCEAFYQRIQRDKMVRDLEAKVNGGSSGQNWALISGSLITEQGEPLLMISFNDIQDRKIYELELSKEQSALKERIKELETIKSLIESTEDITAPISQILMPMLEMIRKGWQYSEDTAVRIEWGGEVYQTSGFLQAMDVFSSEAFTENAQRISVSVGYQSRHPDEQEGPFLREERALLDNITLRLKEYADYRHRNRQLTEQQELMRVMFEHTKDCIAIFDPENGHFIDFNKSAHEGLGYTEEEFRQIRISDIQAEHDEKQIDQNVDLAIGNITGFETVHKAKDGTLQNTVVMLNPITHEGKPYICCVWRDITELKNKEKEQQALTQKLKTHTNLLTSIAGSEAALEGDVEMVMLDLTETVARALSIDRVSCWMLDETKEILKCRDLYRLQQKTHESGLEIRKQDFPEFFEQLLREGRYNAVNTDLEYETDRFIRKYMIPRGVKSFLTTAIMLNGEFVGIIGYAMKTVRVEWKTDDIKFVDQLAGVISLTLLNRERVRTLKTLRQNEKYLSKAQQVSKTGHWNLNITTGELMWSDEACRIFDVETGFHPSLEEFFGRIHPDDRDNVSIAWQAALDGAPYRVTHRILVGEEIRWVEERAEIERNAAAKPVTAIGTVQDITERVNTMQELDRYRHHLEEMISERTRQLEEAKVEAEAANQAKSAFLSNMSHEIRTPMNAIISFAHLIRQDSLSVKQEDYLDKLSDAAKHLLLIINDILDLSKIEANKLTLETKDFDLSRVCDQVCGMIATELEKKGIAFYLDLDHSPLILKGDEARLSQILLNLLSNAVKFTKEGSIHFRAYKKEVENNQLRLRFEVQDTGIGISPDKLGRLFHDFEQADNSITRQFGGTGLGLSISSKLAKLMHGEIGVESEPGVGSTFWVELPFEVSLRETTEMEKLKDLFGVFALMLDQDRKRAAMKTQMLENFGMRIITVPDAKLACETIAERAGSVGAIRFVFVEDANQNQYVSDLMIACRNQNIVGMPRVIAITDFKDMSAMNEAPWASQIRTISKPATPSKMFDAMMEYLERVDIRTITREVDSSMMEQLNRRKGSQILVVEDNEINQEVAKLLLEGVGMRVDLASDGKEALTKVRQKPYQLVLMDIQMPEMDGYEATQTIRHDPSLDHLPIIAMTANAFREEKEKSVACGMNAYLTKPVDPGLLYSTLIQWISPVHAEMPAAEETQARQEQAREEAPESVMNLLRSIRQLDVEAGLRLTDRDTHKYILLLKQFAHTQKDTAQLLLRDWEERNAQALSRRLHTLKGVSGTLGMQPVFSLCDTAYSAMKQSSVEWMQVLEPLEQLCDMLTEIIRLLGEALAESDGGEPAEDSVHDLRETLVQIQKLLRNSDVQANELFHRYESGIVKAFEDRGARLGDLIASFDYSDAIGLITEILA